jgi:hypothetical protein
LSAQRTRQLVSVTHTKMITGMIKGRMMSHNIPPWLPVDVVYFDLQQVSAEELAGLHHPMTNDERRQFADRIDDVARQYRDMPTDLIEYELDLLDGD